MVCHRTTPACLMPPAPAPPAADKMETWRGAPGDASLVVDSCCAGGATTWRRAVWRAGAAARKWAACWAQAAAIFPANGLTVTVCTPLLRQRASVWASLYKGSISQRQRVAQRVTAAGEMTLCMARLRLASRRAQQSAFCPSPELWREGGGTGGRTWKGALKEMAKKQAKRGSSPHFTLSFATCAPLHTSHAHRARIRAYVSLVRRWADRAYGRGVMGMFMFNGGSVNIRRRRLGWDVVAAFQQRARQSGERIRRRCVMAANGCIMADVSRRQAINSRVTARECCAAKTRMALMEGGGVSGGAARRHGASRQEKAWHARGNTLRSASLSAAHRRACAACLNDMFSWWRVVYGHGATSGRTSGRRACYLSLVLRTALSFAAHAAAAPCFLHGDNVRGIARRTT